MRAAAHGADDRLRVAYRDGQMSPGGRLPSPGNDAGSFRGPSEAVVRPVEQDGSHLAAGTWGQTSSLDGALERGLARPRNGVDDGPRR